MSATQRRGICPALATPMATGDGLLARLIPAGALTLDGFAGLCDAALAHGNGVIEITARGSLQIRGLTPASAPLLVEAVDKLAIDAPEGVVVATNPLSGRDAGEQIDAGVLAAALRAEFAAMSLQLAPKLSIVIDSGGALHLDAVAADVRLRADGGALHVTLGGTARDATALGAVAPEQAVAVVLHLLNVLAAHGPTARARELIAAQGAQTFRTAVADYLIAAPPPLPRPPAEPVATHALRDGLVARGIALPFGHADAQVLARLVNAARDAGADSVCMAPGRALLILGLTEDVAAALAAQAKHLGFIVDPRDPRRRVVACAGAPICSSGEISARALAPAIAAAIGPGSGIVHVSGCAKGCAHRGPAALTVIGRDGGCDLLIDGAPAGRVAVDTLLQDIARLAAPRQTG